jgi:hypothetical protein
METLIDYWRRFEIHPGGLNVHPDDRDWLIKRKPSVLDQDRINSFSEYVGSKRFGSSDNNLHLSLLPKPYVGDLANARVLIFLQNPGLEPSDYFAEGRKDFRKLAENNLWQSLHEDYPFFILNPEFAWTAAYIWWESKLRPVIKDLLKSSVCDTYQDALRYLASRVAAVELFPYHSVNSGALNAIPKWHEMPSVLQAKSFFGNVCKDSSKLKLIVRSHRHWDSSVITNDCEHIHSAPRTRGFTFNKEVKSKARFTGEKLMDFLIK